MKTKRSRLRACAGMLLVAAAALASRPALADFDSSAIGTTAGGFLQLAPGARAAAMGEAYSAVADEASALYWNPAALTRIESRSATLMHAPYLGSSFFDYAAYGQNLGDYGAVGAGVQYFSAGSIAQTENYAPVGSFTPYDLALSVGYGFRLKGMGLPLDGFSVGAAAKYVQSHILNSAQTGAVDFGLLSPAYLDEKLRLAFTWVNLGGTLKYEQARENLPMAMRLGGAYRIFKPWLASADVVFPRGDQPYAALGTEFVLATDKGMTFIGRAGYNSQTTPSVTGFTGVSVGAGFGFDRFCLDYAFVPFGGLGQAHRISLTARWGAKSALPPSSGSVSRPEPSPVASVPTPAAGTAESLNALLEALKDDAPEARVKAAIALGKLGNPLAVKPLTASLQDQSSLVRGAAADALGNLGDSRAVGPLIGLLQDPRPKVRALTARALGRLGDRRALTPLQRLAKDADPAVRDKAREAVKKLSQPNTENDDLLRR